ncbi:ABC transporter ATP-binding protein [Xaviernesmea oryzae]|uniref:ABC transporter ATP-binding protein n=1 Tax=Xaviernesmea oryzae TaxID=464029 RepID=A0A1Q9B227_9HYPH|nr:ABC transporter ATP-binding protein [Xaviernesmea oryzae]OLP62022.1 ABC transporter ATP-binding protein [Xaviernesmea oryzae]SEK96630.1 peptide/nickel transport system ATP-binding protein [Xaviernesmea oryzae]
MSKASLIVDNLSVDFAAGSARKSVVRHVSFRVEPGRAVALVGESGSGKSVTARSLVGLAGAGAIVSATRLSYGDRDLRALSQRQWREIRGRDIGFVLQDALVSLDPLRTIGAEIEEALAAHGWGDRASRRRRAQDLLRSVGIPDPDIRALQRSDELSGGLRQRALIATALALDPAIVIADEPTTALDSTVQAQIVALLSAIKEKGHGLLIISHDLHLVSKLADEVVVMHHGDVVEQGPVSDVLAKPRHAYTRALLDAMPGRHPRRRRPIARDREEQASSLPETVLDVRDLTKTFDGPAGSARLAVDKVSFSIQRGRTLGIVGESGSGKTTVARIALGLVTPDEGEIAFAGRPWVASTGRGPRVSEADRRPYRRDLSVIYQDPLSSFDPRWTVGQILSDALQAAGLARKDQARRIADLLAKVRLPIEIADRWPLNLSGGQRQRVAIARALAANPKVVICDEPVSALDVSVQAQVLDLLADLQEELGIAYLFISHDLGVIRQISDDVLVMQSGRAVEQGATEQVFSAPAHPFTKALLQAAS